MNLKTFTGSNPAMYDLTLLLVRIIVGLTFFMHGVTKFIPNGLGGTTGFLEGLGIPAPGLMAVVVTIVETVGGLALIFGIGTRLWGVLLAIAMLVATVTVHLSNGFFVRNGGYELTLLLLVISIGLALSGSGQYSIDSRIEPGTA